MKFKFIALILSTSLLSLNAQAAPLIDASLNRISAAEVRDNGRTAACSLTVGNQHLCALEWNADTRKFFTDFTALPGLGDGSNLKLGLYRYQLEWAEDRYLPFSITFADVTGDASDEKENELKLLDPEQGVNFSFDKAWSFRVHEFCSGNFSGGCAVATRLGGRYLKLNNQVDSTENGVWGGYIDLRVRGSFQIFNFEEFADSPLEEAGNLSVSFGTSYFEHSGSSSNQFFTGINDAMGNPILFDKNFSSTYGNISLSITNLISIKYEYFEPHGIAGVRSQDSLSISFDIMEL